ncbi:S-adenosyl-L-methionine-dependent methyltransferase [Fimicolochytrium jonesii]|uniref:S-adenosyl-L-methionine-dependent methyltransferase n=1 Tax=Fimicolochytrium jonesii TaxID=1396493 RepID=UPI0022FED20C|nr:S-adenosyl-L-methionine-dependent methyltransferase [Fimicolochytrium jonesii]KAI8818324.1 S-adenosyl-L-methionine-dependent methyltransferase [Fimicolochytrium jonesii]
MHTIASQGFNLQSTAYERARPSYPPTVVTHLTQHALPRLSTQPSECHVLDLAAGTGKLTRLLTPFRFKRLVAVEPVEAMRAQFREVVPDVTIVEGTAEGIPFPDASFDAVCIAQAFHWFATPAALREIHRVLKPGGGCALIWNLESPSGLSGQLRELYEQYEMGTPQYRLGLWRKVFEDTSVKALFTEKREVSFERIVQYTEEESWLRILSKSYISCLDEGTQTELERRVREILRGPDVVWREVRERDGVRRVHDFPYQTDLVWFLKK